MEIKYTLIIKELFFQLTPHGRFSIFGHKRHIQICQYQQQPKPNYFEKNYPITTLHTTSQINCPKIKPASLQLKEHHFNNIKQEQ
jgi:hypothetical protein